MEKKKTHLATAIHSMANKPIEFLSFVFNLFAGRLPMPQHPTMPLCWREFTLYLWIFPSAASGCLQSLSLAVIQMTGHRISSSCDASLYPNHRLPIPFQHIHSFTRINSVTPLTHSLLFTLLLATDSFRRTKAHLPF